ncbi:MAG: DUF3413 domain-containing protein, partial [Gammaproteobacteria bacterium]|nr:DUF3413 domain-containing protein [Gammaproteobacteria bacterium]
MSTPLKDKKPISRYSRWYHQRSSSLAWLLNFITLNLFVFWIVGLPYFSFFQLPPAKLLTHAGILLTRFYFVISYLGQLAILALLPLSLFLTPFVIGFPKRGKLLRLLAATLAASLVGLLIIDMSLYRLYHFHFNGIVLHFILGGG